MKEFILIILGIICLVGACIVSIQLNTQINDNKNIIIEQKRTIDFLNAELTKYKKGK